MSEFTNTLCNILDWLCILVAVLACIIAVTCDGHRR